MTHGNLEHLTRNYRAISDSLTEYKLVQECVNNTDAHAPVSLTFSFRDRGGHKTESKINILGINAQRILKDIVQEKELILSGSEKELASFFQRSGHERKDT